MQSSCNNNQFLTEFKLKYLGGSKVRKELEMGYDWKKTLRSFGLRSTSSTLATLRCFETSAQALSHDDLTRQLADAAPDKVTLYRILERLLQAGILQRYADSTRIQRFSLTQRAAVGLFECDNCHLVIPITQDDELKAALDMVKSHLSGQGMTDRETLLSSHGICPDCNRDLQK